MYKQGIHKPRRSWSRQRTTFGSWFSPSVMWVLEIKLRPSDFKKGYVFAVSLA